jgi:integrase
MKARRAHVVYLSQQAMDIMIALKTCAGGSKFLLPSRYEGDKGMSNNTLNRVITVTVGQAKEKDLLLEDFTVHDLRRTASTLLHEAGFNTDWIEKCLAHEQKGVRAIYNKAEYAEQRKDMLQQWANMVDGWIAGTSVTPILNRAAA